MAGGLGGGDVPGETPILPWRLDSNRESRANCKPSPPPRSPFSQTFPQTGVHTDLIKIYEFNQWLSANICLFKKKIHFTFQKRNIYIRARYEAGFEIIVLEH